MKRIPEPEVMDDKQQSEAYALADFSDANALFVDLFVNRFPEFTRGRIADLGCGPADIPIRLCRALPEITVVACDASPHMIALARSAVADIGLSDRIEPVAAALEEFAACGGSFDAVVSNSLLHHLPDPADLWASAARLAKPGAPLLVMDLFRPDTPEAARAIVDASGASESPLVWEDFYRSLLASYTPGEVAGQIEEAGLKGMTVQVVSGRHFAAWGRIRT